MGSTAISTVCFSSEPDDILPREPSSGMGSTATSTAGFSGEIDDLCLYTSVEDVDANEEILNDDVDVHDERRRDGEHVGSNYEDEVQADNFRASEEYVKEVFVKASVVKVKQYGVGTFTTIIEAAREDLRDTHEVDIVPVVGNIYEEVRIDEVRVEDEEDLVKVE